MNLPNALTLLRLLLTPFVIHAILGGRHLLALALFAAAAFTDILDGAAARWLGLATQTGAYLDPIADKCLLSGVYFSLAVARLVPWWFVGIVFGRDLYILIGAAFFFLFTRVRRFPPSVWGKASTFAQIATAVIWLARDLLQISQLDRLAWAMLWVSAAFTVWSGVHYTWLNIRGARGAPAH